MRYLFHIVLVAGAVCLGTGLCHEGWADEREEAEIDFEFRERQLDMKRMEAEVAFQNQMRQLKLERQRVEIDRIRNPKPGANGLGEAVVLLCIVVNILMAVWVYTDNRRRDAGYGIWIVITLLGGFFGALVYAVIRLGDMNASQPASARSTAVKK